MRSKNLTMAIWQPCLGQLRGGGPLAVPAALHGDGGVGLAVGGALELLAQPAPVLHLGPVPARDVARGEVAGEGGVGGLARRVARHGAEVARGVDQAGFLLAHGHRHLGNLANC